MIVASLMLFVFAALILTSSSRRESAAREAWKVRHPYRMPWDDE